MEIKHWAATDVGRKRSHNEDNFLIDKNLNLFVVADGMGGHASGEVASAIAVHTIRDVVFAERDLLTQYTDFDATGADGAVHAARVRGPQRLRPHLPQGPAGAREARHGHHRGRPARHRQRGFIAYVGDSRIYLSRNGVVYPLTEDHSLMNELIRSGKVQAGEFASSPYANFKNAMTRAVGVYEHVEVDILDFEILPGDAFLLCSDGLYDYLEDAEIASNLALSNTEEIPGRFIDMANSRGGKDNVTALVVQVAPDESSATRAAQLNFTVETPASDPADGPAVVPAAVQDHEHRAHAAVPRRRDHVPRGHRGRRPLRRARRQRHPVARRHPDPTIQAGSASARPT
jgi:serine/threonine protein phosphatase PrpC